MRARLAASKDPRRLFRVALDAASAAGLVGAKRVLDSTPLCDAVATMDTITLIRSAIRGVLKATGPELTAELRAVLTSGDEYASNSKPQVDWDDSAAREELIDSRARDGYALLKVLDGRKLEEHLEAAALLATVLGQDLETSEDGVFRDRPAGRQGPGHLHRRPAGPARPQDPSAWVRRLQRPCRGGPGQRDHHRHQGQCRQRR